MGGRLQMNETERQRVGWLGLVVCKELTLASAAVQMGISYRDGAPLLWRDGMTNYTENVTFQLCTVVCTFNCGRT